MSARARHASRSCGSVLAAAGARLHGFVLLGVLALAGCSAAPPVSTWVPADCHGATTPFTSYAIELADVPGFKISIMNDALGAALGRLGLEEVPEADADLLVVLRVTRIERAPLAETPAPDPVSANVPSLAESRFTAHADVEFVDRRDGTLIYKVGMDRDHRLRGDVELHGARAEALIAAAFDEALAGLGRRCD